jgi:microcystin-dependent protein
LQDNTFSGSYSDLTNSPFIPTTLNDLTDVTLQSSTIGQVLTYDGTNWQNQNLPTIGIVSLNSSQSSTQSLVVGNTGNDFNISTADGGVHTFNIPDAAYTKRGLVTTSNQTFTGTKTFQSSLASSVGLIVRGAAAQTANLLEVQTNSFTPVLIINSQGSISVGSWNADTIQISVGGTGASSAQSAINNLTQVSSASDEYVLTKDTTTGNAIWKATASRVTAINSLTSGAQTIATGTTGSDFNVSSSGSTHTLNLPDASATARGVITIGAQTITGTKTIQTSSATNKALILKETTSQSANMFEIQDSSGTPLTVINSSGYIGIPSGGGAASPGLYFTANTNMGLYRKAFNVMGFVSNGQPALMIDGQSGVGRRGVGDTGTVVSRLQLIDDNLVATAGMTFGTNSSTYVQLYRSANNILTLNGGFNIVNAGAGNKALVVKSAVGQSANMFEIQDSSGTPVLSIDSVGSLSVGTVPAARVTGLATVATSGVYSDLTGKPSLATVATSGSYNDLTNKPAIPSLTGYATEAYVDSKVSVAPSGSVMAFAGSSAPGGWLLCNGASVNTYTYSQLHAVISNTYGGSAYQAGTTDQIGAATTFTLPDLRSRAVVGMGSTINNTLGGNDGVAEGSRSLTHSHNTTIPAHYHSMGTGATLNITSSGSGTTGIESGGHTHSVSGTTGNDSPDHTHSGSTGWQSADHGHYVSGTTYTDGSHNHLMPTSRGSATSGTGKVDKNNGTTDSNTGTVDTGSSSSEHSHGFAVWSGGVSANHYHDFTTGGRSVYHQHSFSATSGGVSANHTHTTPSHTHGSANFSGAIGQVTGGVDGNTAQTVSSTSTQNHNYLILNYIIKT